MTAGGEVVDLWWISKDPGVSMFFSCSFGSFVLFDLNRCLRIPWVHVCIRMYLCTLFLNMKYRYVLSKKVEVGIYDGVNSFYAIEKYNSSLTCH